MSLESKQQDLSILKAMLWNSDHVYLMQKAMLGDDAAIASLQAKQNEITKLETEIAALEG